MRNRYIFL